jgi:hypothetical protein
MVMHKLFTQHPASIGETYGEHLVHASCFGARMILAGLACMLHALLPFLCVRTGSQAIEELNAKMLARRQAPSHHPPASELHSPPTYHRARAR